MSGIEDVDVLAWAWDYLGTHVTVDAIQAADLQSLNVKLEPLMTVAQHNRIVEQYKRDAERMREALRDARELIERGTFTEGYCMCGSPVDRHGIGDGHAPVDAGDYYAGQVLERIVTALNQRQSEVEP